MCVCAHTNLFYLGTQIILANSKLTSSYFCHFLYTCKAKKDYSAKMKITYLQLIKIRIHNFFLIFFLIYLRVYVSIFVYIHIYIYIYIHIYIYIIYFYTHTHTFTHIFTHTHIHIYLGCAKFENSNRI